MRSEFNKFIKTTKAQCAYQELEFIAEFGGYVGLFLGISVFHVREAFQRLIHSFTRLSIGGCSQKNKKNTYWLFNDFEISSNDFPFVSGTVQ